MRADQFEKKERQLRAALQETTQRLGRHFANPSARESAGAYLQSLLSSVERKNSWQLAEVAGFETPYRFQHLLGRGAWEADALRDEQLGVVLAGLGEGDTVLAIDETGFIKQGKKSVGVKRQYGGASGKIDNCQVGVFLSWQTARGHALIDRALYLPEEWAVDQERRRVAGVAAGGGVRHQACAGAGDGRPRVGRRGVPGVGGRRRGVRGRLQAARDVIPFLSFDPS